MSTPDGTSGAIAMAVYRPDPELLAVQLDSISAQTLSTWTCHVGIDGWDVDTVQTIERLIGDDQRFVVHHFSENVGFYRNFERTIERASGQGTWVALADQDDNWCPRKLELLVEEMARTGAAAVSGQARVVTRSGAQVATTARRATPLPDLMFDNQVTGSLSVFASDVIELALPFPEPTDAAYHDHWLGVVAASLGSLSFLEECVQDYVQHGGNVLGEETKNRIISRLSRLRRVAARRSVFTYLAEHRWGWRVRMARALVSRSSRSHLLTGVDAVAAGRGGPRVAWSLVRAMGRGNVQIGRGLALLVGAVAWRETPPSRRRPRLRRQAGSASATGSAVGSGADSSSR